jgi:hypothetical protein
VALAMQLKRSPFRPIIFEAFPRAVGKRISPVLLSKAATAPAQSRLSMSMGVSGCVRILHQACMNNGGTG